MSVELSMKEEIVKGDHSYEAEDAYIKMLEGDTKKSRIIKYSLGAFYISLLIVSLFVI